MDPLTLSSSLATLVGLVVNFRQERGERVSLTHQDFVEWLETHRHLEIKKLIVDRAEIQIAVDNVLRAEHSQMLHQLNDISSMLATLLNSFESFSSLSKALGVSSALSDQAINIVRTLVNSDSMEFGIVRIRGGVLLSLTSGGNISISDQRYLPDDLDTLAAWELLTPRTGSNGGQFYRITRNAAKFVATIDTKVSV